MIKLKKYSLTDFFSGLLSEDLLGVASEFHDDGMNSVSELEQLEPSSSSSSSMTSMALKVSSV
jgi:hypothetical protein